MNSDLVNSAEAAGFSPTIDLGHVLPGKTFQATWTFQNNGTTTWNGRYRFTYTLSPHPETNNFPRAPMTSKSSWTLSELGADTVRPGERVQLTLTFTAPDSAGTHATNWQLQTPDGERFGPTRWIRIVVPPISTETLAYQLIKFTNNVANFNNMQPGRQFIATWTLKNTGTAVWSGDYKVAYLETAAADTQNHIASNMGAPATATLRTLSGRERVNPGETIQITMKLTAPTAVGAYAFHWELRNKNGKSFGGTRWLIIGVANGSPSNSTTPLKPRTTQVQFGMNVNINNGHPLDADRLAGLGWVRFVFWATRIKQTPEQAYQNRYKRVIQTYASQGIRSLIILHQDTYWGNAPWDNGNWAAYAGPFAEACGRVAKACAEFGDMVAFQIHNEQDSEFGTDKGNKNPSAIGIPPADYALILQKATAAIRQAHPTAKIVFGGLKTGPQNGIQYIREVKKALGGNLPMDALAYHPYGRFVKTAFFNFGSIGKLDDALDLFKKAFPQLPLWISEVGVAADNPIGPEHYESIAQYIREVVEEVDTKYPDYVEALIWFGWTDIMRNAGILTADNKPKPHIFDAFKNMRQRGKLQAKSIASFTAVSRAKLISSQNTLANSNAVPAGTKFTSRWRFKNIGHTTWRKDYKLVHVATGNNPAHMTAKKQYTLPEASGVLSVAPGETAVFTLNMTAPKLTGRTYRSQWELRDGDNKTFGFLYEEITVIPPPTSGTSVRTPNMRFLKDLTIPDFSQLVAGTDFDKQWQVRNIGKRQWGDGFRLVYIEGDLQMARNISAYIVPSAKQNDTVTLTVPMTSPPAMHGQNTTYHSLWRLQDDRGNYFGDPLWATIVSTPQAHHTSSSNVTALSRLQNDPSIWYSQLDPRWKNDQLGHGRETIGTWGCLITCMSMALSAYGTRLTPQQLNDKLKSRKPNEGGYAANSSSVPFLAPFYIGGLAFNKNVQSWPNKPVNSAVWTGENPISRINKALARGHIVVAQVDSRLNTAVVDQHWVVIVKRAGADYQILDPLTFPTSKNRMTSLKAKYMRTVPSNSVETNLRHSIISTMVYTRAGGSGS